MRKITIAGALVLLASPLVAQNFTTNPDGQPGSNVNNTGNVIQAPLSITQNADTMTITSLNSVACPADNDSYFRRFDLDGEFGITEEYTIEDIDFGVETADPGANVDVILYTIPDGAPFLTANLTEIGRVNAVPITVADLEIQNVVVSGVVSDPVANDLVVEFFAPDTAEGFDFFFGSNDAGQTGPTFLQSAGCGAVEPTDVAVLGFPDMHIVIVVNGDVADPVIPMGPPTVEIPTLGTVAMAGMIGLLSILGLMVMRRRF